MRGWSRASICFGDVRAKGSGEDGGGCGPHSSAGGIGCAINQSNVVAH